MLYIILCLVLVVIGVVFGALRASLVTDVSTDAEESVAGQIPGSPFRSRKCPQCAEHIQLEALICRYCGFSMDHNLVRTELEAERRRIEKAKDEKIRSERQGLLFAKQVIGWISALVGAGGVGAMVIVAVAPPTHKANGEPPQEPVIASLCCGLMCPVPAFGLAAACFISANKLRRRVRMRPVKGINMGTSLFQEMPPSIPAPKTARDTTERPPSPLRRKAVSLPPTAILPPADIVFQCPACMRQLKSPRQAVGQPFKCPHCNSTGNVPDGS